MGENIVLYDNNVIITKEDIIKIFGENKIVLRNAKKIAEKLGKIYNNVAEINDYKCFEDFAFDMFAFNKQNAKNFLENIWIKYWLLQHNML